MNSTYTVLARLCSRGVDDQGFGRDRNTAAHVLRQRHIGSGASCIVHDLRDVAGKGFRERSLIPE